MSILTKMMKTKTGRIFISILLGFGLASLFRKVCHDRKCIIYKNFSPSDILNNTYQHKDKCYTYKTESTECNDRKIN